MAAGAVAAVGLVLTGALVVRPLVRTYTGVAAPQQFLRPLSAPPHQGGRDVLGVAHNAGNDAGTTAAALDHGAEVVEIDVVTVGGTLAAGRARQWRWLAELVFRGDTLAEAWNHAAAAPAIQLDLQETDRALLDAVISFLDHHAAARPRVLVSTRDAAAIAYLRPRLSPAVTLLFSVPFPHAVDRVRTDDALAGAIGGVTVFDGLVSAELVGWAHRHDLLVFAWTVNGERRLDRLLRLGVDGVATDNLAILRALSRPG